VEHPCPRCNASVDDSSPFCPTCEAAQVRATTREYSRVPVNVAESASSAVVFAETEPLPSRTTARADAHPELRSALYAGIVAAVLSMIQPGASFILAMPLGGFLSVLLYRRRSMGEEPGPRAGFRLGTFTGLVAFCLLLLIAVGTLAFHPRGDMHADIVQIIQQAQARSPDPQAKQVFDYFLTPQGMAFVMIFGFFFMCILFVLLSGIGGAISASLLRRKGPPRP
jgi:hypothetical protein